VLAGCLLGKDLVDREHEDDRVCAADASGLLAGRPERVLGWNRQRDCRALIGADDPGDHAL
jgi:hypothetical protein